MPPLTPLAEIPDPLPEREVPQGPETPEVAPGRGPDPDVPSAPAPEPDYEPAPEGPEPELPDRDPETPTEPYAPPPSA